MMANPTTDLLLRVNGIQPAFGFEFGMANPRCDEGRAADPYRQANVSYSLVQRREREVVRHTLIDVGMGVVPSLLEFEHSHHVHVVHEVFLSHPHFDHYAQLEWLSMSLHRNGRPEQPRPLPVHASPECWERGPARVFTHLDDRVEHRPLRPGTALVLDDLTITPFAVVHKESAPGALGFVAQYGRRKIVMTCDFLTIPGEDDPLLHGADVCLMESNTWHPAPHTGHQSVQDALRLVHKWKPKRTCLIHYSGVEDQKVAGDTVHGPLSLDRFEAELARVSGGFDVRPARHGMIFGANTPWPDDHG
jgi:phosphoribosyl 1,2-cyclic phosphodiesterase